MKSDLAQALTWQYNLTWQLFEYHLPSLTDQICLWEPSSMTWNVRLSQDGLWRPDFSEVEPIPVPTVTIGWISWQILWYWESTLNVVEGRSVLKPDEVFWPGTAPLATSRIKSLNERWKTYLAAATDAELNRKIVHLWPEPTPIWQSVAWLNSELMKNISEMGYIRFLYAHKSS